MLYQKKRQIKGQNEADISKAEEEIYYNDVTVKDNDHK